jgi:hypothetical protein
LVATAFENNSSSNNKNEVGENATGVANSPFTEFLLRNILSLRPTQQLTLVKDLAENEISKGDNF